MPRPARALLAAVLAGTLLVGCSLLPDDAPSAAAPSTPSTSEAPTGSPAGSPADPGPPASGDPAATTPASATPAADDVRTAGTAVPVGDRTVLHALAVGDASIATGTDDDPDVTVLRADPGAPAGPVAVALAAPVGGRIAVQDDGSFVVLAADGTFLAGAARPTTQLGGAPVTVTAPAQDVVRAESDDGVLVVRVAGRALVSATWGEREGGRSLAVAPSPWARSAGQAGEVGVWTELVTAVPEAGTPVMRDQLACHALGAPDKPTWNLEPWRPDVGLLAVLAAACNPA